MTYDDILHATAAAEQALARAANAAALEELRIQYIGRNGLLPRIMKGLKDAEPAERPRLGQAANRFKEGVQAAWQAREAALAAAADEASGPGVDLTLPGAGMRVGGLHPITQILEHVQGVFRAIGFTVASGPDIDTVEHNFDALNTPADHPSRDPQDTFYLSDGRLLRTHTSPIQIRYMKAHPPPVRIIAPGRAYRRDTPDATHSANFHQLEGLYVSGKVSLADLKGDLTHFARQILGPRTRIRFRPHFFPFTEPSVEVDFSCHVCAGKGCRVCKQSGWIEIAGAGMVDPHVFRAVGYDPEAVTGYAFGLGLERIAMILLEIQDIRHLYENDARFLAPFAR
jgi:phenylalanyl-tRNA synthetase alpha chain